MQSFYLHDKFTLGKLRDMFFWIASIKIVWADACGIKISTTVDVAHNEGLDHITNSGANSSTRHIH